MHGGGARASGYAARHSGADGADQGVLAARRGESAENGMIWALNGVESTLGT